MTDVAAQSAIAQVNGDMRMAISNAIVALHREHYGKGPTKVKTYVFDEFVLCVLRGNRTRLDTTLAEGGREDLVLDVRHQFQRTMEKRFTDAVEQATGREVTLFMSQSSVDPDVSIEFFALGPPGPADA